jgi:hypothetical protein
MDQISLVIIAWLYLTVFNVHVCQQEWVKGRKIN